MNVPDECVLKPAGINPAVILSGAKDLNSTPEAIGATLYDVGLWR